MRLSSTLTLIFLGLLTTLSAHSSWELRTDFRAAVSTDTLDRTVQENYKAISGQEVFQVPDFQIQSNGIPVAVSGIFGRVQYTVNTPVRSGSSLVWDTTSENVKVELAIQRISAFTIIRREFNGGVIDIRVEGSCDNVRLSIPAQAGARIFARVKAMLNEGNLRLATESTNVQWPENAWQVDRLECTGIEGFGATVRAEALKNLAKPQKDVQAGLYTAIQKRLDGWAANAMNIAVAPRLIFENRSDVVMQTHPEKIVEQTGGNVLMNGLFRVIMPNIGGDTNEVVKHGFAQGPSGAFQGSETQVPAASVKSFLMAAFFAKVMKAQFSSFDFKPFYAMMQDRTAQAYAFPDLQRFSKEAHFIFQTAVHTAPIMKNLRASGEPGVLTAEVTIPATIQMLAPRVELQKHVPYVQFEGNIRGTALFKVVDGKLAIRVQGAKVTMAAAWNKSYVEKYKPKTTIKSDLIASKLAESLNKETFSVNLPYWQWQNNQRLVPVLLGLEGEQVKVFWETAGGVPGGVAAR